MVLVALSLLLSIFALFSVSHMVFLYYDFFYKGEVDSVTYGYIALFLFLVFAALFHLVWLSVNVGFILLLTDGFKHRNFGRTMLGFVLWFLFPFGFYGFFYLILRLQLDIFTHYFLISLAILAFTWITLPLFIPLMSMCGKKYLKRILILLPVCGVPAIAFSFFDYSESTMFSFVFIEIYYLAAMFALTVGYYRFYRWTKSIPRGCSRDEMLAHKFVYWYEDDVSAPDQIISQSDCDFITLTVKPVPKESLLPAKALKISIAAIVVTLLYSLNWFVLKSQTAWVETLRSVSIPLFGMVSIIMILIALVVSGYTVHNIRSGRFQEDKKGEYAMVAAIGATVIFLALSLSIGLYML